MLQINEKDAHIIPSQKLNDLSEENWNFIKQQRNSFIISDNCGPNFLRWPGYVFSSLDAQSAYMRIYEDFINQKIYTPSRGNLSKNNNHIFIGIRPSHAMLKENADLRGNPAWFLGESSVMLCRLLSELNLYPYVGNIYNQPTQPFNKDFKFIFKELVVIMYIYKVIYGMSELNLMLMGNYEEFPIFADQLKFHPIYERFKIKVNTYSMWHPSYLVRSYSDDKFDEWKKQVSKKKRQL